MTAAAHEARANDRSIFGFWVYLMTDLIMFAGLFAAFAVLRNNTFGGPAGHDFFNLPFVLEETMILLTSSFSCGLMTLAANRGDKKQTFLWLAATFVLGVSFLTLELGEFSRLVAAGNGWTRSAFLSSYFALVGTHGLHIAVGLLWIAVAAVQIWIRDLTPFTASKLNRFALFWHFLDLVWIFIFTIVYLMGAAL